jgi:DNA-binding transcriptional ArsR family regulator
MTYGTVMVALADPTRRLLFERLRSRPHTVGELARIAKIQQPSVSQHLRVLRGARLVRDRREGTRRYYSASQEGLAELRRYIERMWDDVLTAYAAEDPNLSKSRVVAPPKRKGAR